MNIKRLSNIEVAESIEKNTLYFSWDNISYVVPDRYRKRAFVIRAIRDNKVIANESWKDILVIGSNQKDLQKACDLLMKTEGGHIEPDNIYFEKHSRKEKYYFKKVISLDALIKECEVEIEEMANEMEDEA